MFAAPAGLKKQKSSTSELLNVNINQELFGGNDVMALPRLRPTLGQDLFFKAPFPRDTGPSHHPLLGPGLGPR